MAGPMNSPYCRFLWGFFFCTNHRTSLDKDGDVKWDSGCEHGQRLPGTRQPYFPRGAVSVTSETQSGRPSGVLEHKSGDREDIFVLCGIRGVGPALHLSSLNHRVHP